MPEFRFDALLNTLELRGALDADIEPEGVTFRRLPDWTRRQIPKELDPVLSKLSGVRLAFVTDARSLNIKGRATAFVPPFSERPPVCFQLDFGDGTLSSERSAGDAVYMDGWDADRFAKEVGEDETWNFSLPAGEKQCELWLPHNAIVLLKSLSINEGATLQRPPHDTRPLWVHYGSSISHCLEARRPIEIWPAIAARETDVSLFNLGLAGQCHLDPFVARTIRDLPADIISIKAGINIVNRDTIRERAFAPVLHGFLDTIRERQPDTPISLISPIYCPAIELHPGPTGRGPDGKLVTISGQDALRAGSLTLQKIRATMADFVAGRDDPNLRYFDGLELLGAEDARNLYDDLHPDAEGYQLMGQRFAAKHLKDVISRPISQ
ncbi:MAG: SGNH/GDSL hydrolase family protein [Henriciella sp.]